MLERDPLTLFKRRICIKVFSPILQQGWVVMPRVVNQMPAVASFHCYTYGLLWQRLAC